MTLPAISIAAQLAQLPTLPMKNLWDLWDEFFDHRPGHHHRTYLESRIAYKLQERALGVLPSALRRKLERIGESGQLPGQTRATDLSLAPGTVLQRDHAGMTHRVTVLPNGRFEYLGQPYRSLSAIARAITGTQWDGRVFFGVKKVGGA